MKFTSYELPDVTGSVKPAATAEGATQKVTLSTPGQNARYSVK